MLGVRSFDILKYLETFITFKRSHSSVVMAISLPLTDDSAKVLENDKFNYFSTLSFT